MHAAALQDFNNYSKLDYTNLGRRSAAMYITISIFTLPCPLSYFILFPFLLYSTLPSLSLPSLHFPLHLFPPSPTLYISSISPLFFLLSSSSSSSSSLLPPASESGEQVGELRLHC